MTPRSADFAVFERAGVLKTSACGLGWVSQSMGRQPVGRQSTRRQSMGHPHRSDPDRRPAVSTELRRLRNYINGEFRDAADGRTTEVVNPATGEAYATAPLSAAADVDAAMAAAEAAFPAWRDLVPAERQKVLLKIADRFEERAEELIAAESENWGKPIALVRSEEIPPMVDQIRFFAGAARMLEGRSAGEYMDGFTS